MNRISNSQKARGINSIIEQFSMNTDISESDRLYSETRQIVAKLAKIKQQKETERRKRKDRERMEIRKEQKSKVKENNKGNGK